MPKAPQQEVPKYLASFGRRQVRGIKPTQKELFDTLLPEIEISIPASGNIKPAALFPEAEKIYLEIGYGGGEHLAGRAAQEKTAGFIGCEVFTNGIAKCLQHIHNEQLSNVKLFMDDARLLLEALPDNSLDGVYILFPDPWPKSRHHKRRIINPATLVLLARLIRRGGFLRIATDHMEYLRWIFCQMLPNTDFVWPAKGPESWQPFAQHVPTRYETKARKQGKVPVFLEYIRQ